MAFPAIVGAIGGSALTAKLAGNAASKQRNWARENYQNRFQWSMADMKAAGLNPILAAQMGLGGGGTPSGSMAAVPDFGKVGEVANTGSRVQIERGLAKANIGAITATTAKTEAERQNVLKQNTLLDLQMPRARALGALDTNVVGPGLEKATQWLNTAKSSTLSKRTEAVLQWLRDNGLLNEEWSQNKWTPMGWESKAPRKGNAKGKRND